VAAGIYKLRIEQGSRLYIPITSKDADGNLIDYSTYTARAMFRYNIEDASPALEMTTENGYITLSASDPNILFDVPASVTAALRKTTEDDKPVWDLELIPVSGEDDAFRHLEGPAEVSREVTR
jgi:hypothetical protein